MSVDYVLSLIVSWANNEAVSQLASAALSASDTPRVGIIFGIRFGSAPLVCLPVSEGTYVCGHRKIASVPVRRIHIHNYSIRTTLYIVVNYVSSSTHQTMAGQSHRKVK